MIHKMVIALCLLLALAILVIGVASYRGEIVCRGKAQGLTWGKGFFPIFNTQNDYIGLTTSRTSFVNGTFLHLWTSKYTGTGQNLHRKLNGVVFRWIQSPTALFRLNPNKTTGTVVLSFQGILMNILCIPLWAPFVLFLLYPVLFFSSMALLFVDGGGSEGSASTVATT